MSALEHISDIGDKRAKQLQDAGLETAWDVHSAALEDLEAIDGIGDDVARTIKDEAATVIRQEETEAGVPLDRRTHRRFLETVNEVRSPEALAERIDVELGRAQQVLEHRTGYPLGFDHVEDLVGPELVDEDLLERIPVLFGPAVDGAWEPQATLTTAQGHSFKPVHAAMLHTGDVLFIKHTHGGHHGGHGGSQDWTQVWDPAKKGGQSLSAPANQPSADLYCSGHSFLSNGELLVVGGGGAATGNEPDYGWIFDPDASGGSGRWRRTQGGTNAGRVVHGRWYPTLVTVGPNRVLVANGGTDELAIYDQAADDFTAVSGTPGVTAPGGGDPAQRDFPPRYPGLHYTPSGRVVYTKTGFEDPSRGGTHTGDPDKPQYFEFTGAREGHWSTPFAQPHEQPRTKGMSVQILKQDGTTGWTSEILVVGGAGGSAARSVESLDPDASPPTWSKHPFTFNTPRINVNATVLADGTVFVCGGTTTKNSACYIYDPWATQNPWTQVASLPSVREYHSFGLLLPSGKVLVGSADKDTIDVYRPPYLYDGTSLASRPQIQSAPSRIHHGSTFSVTMGSTDPIQKLTMVRPMAVTHQTDSEQRAIPLRFSQNGATLTATAPNGNHPHPVAPRGHYMLFAIDDDGVPSHAEFVHLH